MRTKKLTRRASLYDPALLFPVILLVGAGIVMVFSASSMLAYTRNGSELYYLNRQLVFALIGIGVLIGCRHMPYRILKAGAYIVLLAALALLALVLVPGIGHEVGGARRWLRFLSISFQPTELARFAMVIYLAYSLSRKNKEQLNRFAVGFVPHVAVLGIFAVLIYGQPDYGSIVILSLITWIMLFVGGVPVKHLLGTALLAAPIGFFFMLQAGYRVRRVLSFLDPWKYSSDAGYQIVHSLMAFGSGGISGVGFGLGHQKRFYLPEPHTDFIFSVIGEELGLIVVLCIVLLFVVLLWRGLMIARNTEDLFGAYLALGISISIGIQASVNMGVTLGMLPTKGLTLPFLSYGGTSLVMNMACIGILMNIEASGRSKTA